MKSQPLKQGVTEFGCGHLLLADLQLREEGKEGPLQVVNAEALASVLNALAVPLGDPQPVERVREAGLGADVTTAVLGGNPDRLLNRSERG